MELYQRYTLEQPECGTNLLTGEQYVIPAGFPLLLLEVCEEKGTAVVLDPDSDLIELPSVSLVAWQKE